MSYAWQAAAKIAVSHEWIGNDRKGNKCSEIAILLSGSMLYFFNRRGKRGSLEICKEIDHISENLKECFWYNGDTKENLVTDFSGIRKIRITDAKSRKEAGNEE